MDKEIEWIAYVHPDIPMEKARKKLAPAMEKFPNLEIVQPTYNDLEILNMLCGGETTVSDAKFWDKDQCYIMQKHSDPLRELRPKNSDIIN